ncbi:putative membrane protein [Chitinophaga skermanii]|uniref:Putative membrane protein n=1 Tax=Chitinophaga skermanii TaxID=331697 RepID=A0A327QIH9_9BACT|nr:phage holin family protein [Chitinophaga skermanii]RAJ01507.1 putative membrane protein [Chitinophaga skermanii]
MNILIRLLINALAAFVTASLLPGVHIKDFMAAIILAVVLGVLNLLVRPVLLLLTLPVTVFTLGLFIFVINACIILLAGELVSGFTVDGFWWALLFSLVMSLISGFMYSLGPGARRED